MAILKADLTTVVATRLTTRETAVLVIDLDQCRPRSFVTRMDAEAVSEPRLAHSAKRGGHMAEEQATVALVAADDTLRDSFHLLLESSGYKVQAHQSGDSLLAGPLSALACVVVDHSPPALNGLELIEHIRSRGETIPTVLIAVPLSTHEAERASKLTAVTVLQKPLVADALLSYLCSIFVPPNG